MWKGRGDKEGELLERYKCIRRWRSNGRDTVVGNSDGENPEWLRNAWHK